MKRLIFTLVAILAFFSLSFAQNEEKKEEQLTKKKSQVYKTEESGAPQTPEQKAEHQTKKLTKAAVLTEAQIPQVKSIFLDRAQKIQAIKTKYDSASDKSPMNQEIKTVKTESDNAMRKILTAEQYNAYLKTRE